MTRGKEEESRASSLLTITKWPSLSPPPAPPPPPSLCIILYICILCIILNILATPEIKGKADTRVALFGQQQKKNAAPPSLYGSLRSWHRSAALRGRAQRPPHSSRCLESTLLLPRVFLLLPPQGQWLTGKNLALRRRRTVPRLTCEEEDTCHMRRRIHVKANCAQTHLPHAGGGASARHQRLIYHNLNYS